MAQSLPWGGTVADFRIEGRRSAALKKRCGAGQELPRRQLVGVEEAVDLPPVFAHPSRKPQLLKLAWFDYRSVQRAGSQLSKSHCPSSRRSRHSPCSDWRAAGNEQARTPRPDRPGWKHSVPPRPAGCPSPPRAGAAGRPAAAATIKQQHKRTFNISAHCQNEVSEDQVPHCPLEDVHEDPLEVLPLPEGELQPLPRRPDARSPHELVPRQLAAVQRQRVPQDVLYLVLGVVAGGGVGLHLEVQGNVLHVGTQASLLASEGEAIVFAVYDLHLRHYEVVPREWGLLQGSGEGVLELSA